MVLSDDNLSAIVSLHFFIKIVLNENTDTFRKGQVTAGLWAKCLFNKVKYSALIHIYWLFSAHKGRHTSVDESDWAFIKEN